MEIIKSHASLPKGHGYVLLTRLELDDLDRQARKCGLPVEIFLKIILAPASVVENFPRLSNRQRDVGFAVLQGYENREIADRLNISENTVKVYIKGLFDAFFVHNRAALAIAFLQNYLTRLNIAAADNQS